MSICGPGAHDDGVIHRDGRELGRGRQQEDGRLALGRATPVVGAVADDVADGAETPGAPVAVEPGTRR